MTNFIPNAKGTKQGMVERMNEAALQSYRHYRTLCHLEEMYRHEGNTETAEQYRNDAIKAFDEHMSVCQVIADAQAVKYADYVKGIRITIELEIIAEERRREAELQAELDRINAL